MANSYQVRAADVLGVEQTIIADHGPGAFAALDLAYAVNAIGALTLTLDATRYDKRLFPRDARLIVERSIDGASPYAEGERAWLVRRAKRSISADGIRQLVITAVDGPHLLKRRIVAYNAGTSETSKTGTADDVCKAIVRENFVSATDTTRNLAATLFAVQPDLTAGASISKAFARRVVLTVLQELAEASTTAGTYLAFDVVWTGSLFEFRTYAGQRGVDHSSDSGQPVLIGPDFGNLADVEDTDDAMDEVTVVYAGGQGEKATRDIATALDSVRIGASPFNRIEDFRQSNNTEKDDIAQLQDEADSALRAGRPRRIVSGTFIDTPGVTYGRHIHFGDIVPASVDGDTVDCRIDAVHLAVEGGRETVDLRLRSET